MRAGERGAAGGGTGALDGFGCLGAFSFFCAGGGFGVELAVSAVGSDGVFAWTVSLLGTSVGFVRPTTRGLSWPLDGGVSAGGPGVVGGAIWGCAWCDKLLARAWKRRLAGTGYK